MREFVEPSLIKTPLPPGQSRRVLTTTEMALFDKLAKMQWIANRRGNYRSVSDELDSFTTFLEGNSPLRVPLALASVNGVNYACRPADLPTPSSYTQANEVFNVGSHTELPMPGGCCGDSHRSNPRLQYFRFGTSQNWAAESQNMPTLMQTPRFGRTGRGQWHTAFGSVIRRGNYRSDSDEPDSPTTF